jgi:polar amino acid transport system substrate-binding protein
MKMMKRFAAVCIAATMAAAVFAGGSKGAKKSGKKYLIATDTTFAPFEFEDAKGKFVGIDMDLLAAIAKDQGFNYEIQVLGFNAAVQSLESKQSDGVIAGMSITDERKKKFDFSDPYFDSGVVMGIAKTNSAVKSYADLKGKQVAIKTGTEGASFAESIMNTYGFTVAYFEDSANMYEDVKTGNSVACFEDYPVLGYGISQGIPLKIVTPKEKGSSYGFAVNKGLNGDLLAKFNKGLADVKANGTYQAVLDKYIKK